MEKPILQVYLVLDDTKSRVQLGADLLFNHSFDEECPWKFVDYTLLPPACLPKELQRFGCACLVKDHTIWILKGAVESGLCLNIIRLRHVCVALRLKIPKKGSGKKGGVKKVDLAALLVRHLFPECTKDFLSQCVATLCGWKTWKTVQVDLSVLAMAASMDTDNADAFKRLKRHAEMCLEEKIFGRGKTVGLKTVAEDPELMKETTEKAKDQEGKQKTKEANRLWNLTPDNLKALLPGHGSIQGIFWMRFHPMKKFWRADFPCGFSACICGFFFGVCQS